MTNTYIATLAEVKAVFTSYMRMTHDLTLEVDDGKLERLLTSVREARTDEVTPEVTLEVEDHGFLEILEVDGTRIALAIPAGFPVVMGKGARKAYYANTPIGRPGVAVKLVDLEHMVTREALERDVRVTKAIADLLEVGKFVNSSVPEVDPTPAPAPKTSTPEKPTRKDRRFADHESGRCTCQRPPGHPCPYVRDFGGTILKLEWVLETIAAEKAAK